VVLFRFGLIGLHVLSFGLSADSDSLSRRVRRYARRAAKTFS